MPLTILSCEEQDEQEQGLILCFIDPSRITVTLTNSHIVPVHYKHHLVLEEVVVAPLCQDLLPLIVSSTDLVPTIP